MPGLCILTDSSAQLPHIPFHGQQRVKILPLDPFQATQPSQETWSAILNSLGHGYDAILVITLSGALSPLVQWARQAAVHHGGRTPITVVDSLNLGAGLGLLVKLSAEQAEAGQPASAIEDLVRATMPHLYSIYCLPDQSLAGRLLPQQFSAETPGIMPILTLEDGRLIPFQKVRTTRHLLEAFQEFISEYDQPRHIILSKGRESRLRLRPLRQFISETFPLTPFAEYILSPTLEGLLGNTAVGLVIQDTPARGHR